MRTHRMPYDGEIAAQSPQVSPSLSLSLSRARALSFSLSLSLMAQSLCNLCNLLRHYGNDMRLRMLTYALLRHCGNDVRWRACTFNYDFAAVTQV